VYRGTYGSESESRCCNCTHTLDVTTVVLSNGLIGKHVIMLSVFCILFGGRNM